MDNGVWTIGKIINWTKQYFEARGIENPRLDAELLLCDVLKCERIRLYVDFDCPLSKEELSIFKGYVQRRGNQEPLAYILGEKAFMRNSFKVTPDTLIPRPETELLVESILKAVPLLFPNAECPKLLDIGTGSGAIIVSLLDYLPEAKGVGVDISVGALTVARENAERIGVLPRAGFVRSDLFSRVPGDKLFDVIVSNPPYIPTKVIPTLAQDVQKEPITALDGGEDGLELYRRIIAEAPAHLAETGLLALEIGIDESEAVMAMCRKAGFKYVAVRKDYADIDRMVFAIKAAEEDQRYEDLLLEITRE